MFQEGVALPDPPEGVFRAGAWQVFCDGERPALLQEGPSAPGRIRPVRKRVWEAWRSRENLCSWLRCAAKPHRRLASLAPHALYHTRSG